MQRTLDDVWSRNDVCRDKISNSNNSIHSSPMKTAKRYILKPFAFDHAIALEDGQFSCGHSVPNAHSRIAPQPELGRPDVVSIGIQYSYIPDKQCRTTSYRILLCIGAVPQKKQKVASPNNLHRCRRVDTHIHHTCIFVIPSRFVLSSNTKQCESE